MSADPPQTSRAMFRDESLNAKLYMIAALAFQRRTDRRRNGEIDLPIAEVERFVSNRLE